MTSTDDLDDILEGLSYEDLQALSDELDPEVGYEKHCALTSPYCANPKVFHRCLKPYMSSKPKLVPIWFHPLLISFQQWFQYRSSIVSTAFQRR